MLHIFLIEDSERHWVCATDEADARAVYQENMGEPVHSPNKVTQMSPSYVLGVRDDDERKTTKKPCSEWVKEGRSFIASSVF